MQPFEQEPLESQDGGITEEGTEALSGEGDAEEAVAVSGVEASADDLGAEEPVAEEPVAEEPVAEEPVAEEPVAEEPIVDENAEWYFVHTYSGYENKVKAYLDQRIETMGMQDRIFRVIVPTEEEVEIRDGQRRTTRRRVFPGYILVQAVLDDESWYVVRNTPGVTGFVGTGTKPISVGQDEVDRILQRMEAEQPRIKVSFRVGETVRISEGPFADFMAVVDELYPEQGKVRVFVSLFGRETPVEMDFLQVERI